MTNRTLFNRCVFLALSIALVLASAVTALAKPVNAKNGVAIRGYDAVAYFTEKKAKKGDKSFSHKHQGVTWLFASQKHLDLFKASPSKYMPQYGSYCAYAMALNQKVDVDPTLWKVVGGKLYLNYNKQAASTWEKDIPGYIKKADTNWAKM